jgi:hypothetical protein
VINVEGIACGATIAGGGGAAVVMVGTSFGCVVVGVGFTAGGAGGGAAEEVVGVEDFPPFASFTKLQNVSHPVPRVSYVAGSSVR